MSDQDARFGVILSLKGGRHLVEPQLTEPELRAIGYLAAQWAFLEHVLFMHTVKLTQIADAAVPRDAINRSFSKRLRAWRSCIEEYEPDLDEKARLLVL